MAPAPSRTIAVVDDDPHALDACDALLSRAGWRIERFGAARDAVAAARRGGLPRVVLMDMHLPGESAGAAIAAIRRAMPEALIVAHTSHAEDAFVFEALRAGAVGYVLKHRAPEELAPAIEAVERGGSPLSPAIARRVLATFHAEEATLEPLSPREREILACFADGATYDEAAARLGISIDTVRTHVRRLYAKLQVTSRTQAVLTAIRRGLLGR